MSRKCRKNLCDVYTHPSSILREIDPPIPLLRGKATEVVVFRGEHVIENQITTLKLLNKEQKAKRGNRQELSG
jgi:hypothetical protein